MKLVRSSQETRIFTGNTVQTPEESAARLSSMTDGAWRVLIDFRNWPNWIPGVREVQQMDQESPGRGTQLQIHRAGRDTLCSIDRWDPPRTLHLSLDVMAGEMALGFTIAEKPKESVLCISLELERSIHHWASPLAFFLRWRLHRLGRKILARLVPRIQASLV